MIAATPVALAAAHGLSPIAAAEGLDRDRITAAAHDELVAASLAWERSHAETGDLGAGIEPFVERLAGLQRELVAEHGEDAGTAIWRAAMRRHRRWQVE